MFFAMAALTSCVLSPSKASKGLQRALRCQDPSSSQAYEAYNDNAQDHHHSVHLLQKHCMEHIIVFFAQSSMKQIGSPEDQDQD